MSTLYDLSANGPGTFTFDPVSTFQVMGSDHTVKTDVANVYPISVSITDDVSKRELHFEKRQTAVCVGYDNKTEIISKALYDAPKLADSAIFYIKNGNDSRIHKTYFGNNDRAKVQANFEKIAKMQYITGIVSCEDPLTYNCVGNPSSAYITGSNIRVCEGFYDQLDLTALCDDKIVGPHHTSASTILGQVAQVLNIGGTDAVGCKQSRKLGDDKKIINADNYRVST